MVSSHLLGRAFNNRYKIRLLTCLVVQQLVRARAKLDQLQTPWQTYHHHPHNCLQTHSPNRRKNLYSRLTSSLRLFPLGDYTTLFYPRDRVAQSQATKPTVWTSDHSSRTSYTYNKTTQRREVCFQHTLSHRNLPLVVY